MVVVVVVVAEAKQAAQQPASSQPTMAADEDAPWTNCCRMDILQQMTEMILTY